MKRTVVAFGETAWEDSSGGERLGGAVFKLAGYLRQLGDRVLPITRLGEDEPGRRAWEEMNRLGLELAQVQRDPKHATGRMRMPEKPHGVPTVLPDAAFDYIETDARTKQIMAEANCLYFGILSQRSMVSRQALRALLAEVDRRALLFLDVNLHPESYSLEVISDSLRHAHVAQMNLQEAHFLADLFEVSDSSLSGFCEEMIEQWALDSCIVTLGDRGVFARRGSETAVYSPGYRVTSAAVYSGAGEAFAGGFIHRRLRGASLAESIEFGNAVAALAISGRRVNETDVRQFLAAPPERFAEPGLEDFATPK